MKLKNVLVLAFLVLTLIPIVIVSILLYNSGIELSQESYTRNLIESITVQADYISQTVENNMIADYRFANKNHALFTEENSSLLSVFQSYLETSEDKISVCLLLDQNNKPLYTIGEKTMLDVIGVQLPQLSELGGQTIQEFDLGGGAYSLGIITPVRDHNDRYTGSLISIYDKSYLFKIISSYYKISDTSTYICREGGEIINFGGFSAPEYSAVTKQILNEMTFSSEGVIDTRVGNVPVLGYYQNIYDSPWFLVGFIDNQLIYSFTNQFLGTYIFIILLVFLADVILSFSFSKKVVEPIEGLIQVMDDYQNSLNSNDLQCHGKNGYYETRYLRTKFLSLMKTILLVQHNFEGIYQLYQSSAMDDTNIDIDVKNQTVHSNKESFETLMHGLDLPKEDCVVQRFIKCFCEKDQILLLDMFETMRDEHLAVTREAEIYTPYLNQKWFHTLVVPMYEDDRLSRLFIQLRDISNFKKQEFESIEQSRKDPLTQLYNRSGFTACVNTAVQMSDPSQMHGLMFLDMNYFKMVNDNLGHSEGDELLRSVGRILQNTAGPHNFASRFGGDEFAIFFPDTTIEELEKTKDILQQRLIFPFETDTISFTVSVSIGISIWDTSCDDTLETMLKRADTTMYQAKREFKQRSLQK